ncbi:hypothetical protein ACONUD_03125 [Microbulbifer harenosus]|uniref:Uncharacterized protein n=1 Tax=Microbulbifer harenosus TaxID=2576840 RepID=A0ABY2UJW8_9GAMM|nr:MULTISPECIES: hypothetical protein [Microbulbifer]QIL89536.1 hypothetical protein GNX18_07040 [Microbulbifer sp. SH-1]TLM78390.1 hypothetical protein FDY93_06250 [Microbulbifer harenosus]
MKLIGPPLQTILQRVTECPADFLDEPRIGSQGRLEVASLVGDCLRLAGYRASAMELKGFGSRCKNADRKHLQFVALCVWLLDAKWFRQAQLEGFSLLNLLQQDMAEFAQSSHVDKCLHDAERREEFSRYVLARLGFRPEGESESQASDRLSALSSIERQRLLKESQEAERRAREIREALARKAAAESADKWTRE